MLKLNKNAKDDMALIHKEILSLTFRAMHCRGLQSQLIASVCKNIK